MRKAVRIPTAILAAALVASSLSARQTSRGYELEYIETPGTTTGPWIDTGVKPKLSIRTVIDMACLSTVKNAGLFGIVNQTVSYTMYRNTAATAGWGMAHQDGNGDWQYSGHLADTARHVFDFNRYIAASNAYFLVYDGMEPYTKLTGSLTKTGSQAIGLGIRRSGATAGDLSLHRIWACQIYDGENLVRDFVPWATYAGETGLWDCENGAMYESAGTTGYAGGQAVTNRVYFFSEWEDKCASSPAFGKGGHVYAHGETVSVRLTAPALDENGVFDDGEDHFVFQGWRLWRNGAVVETGSGTTASFVHDASSIEELEWCFDPFFYLTFSAEGPGTLSTNRVLLHENDTVTVTATPAAGKALFRWKGDMNLGDDQLAGTATFTATAARHLVAEFYDPATEPRISFEAIESTSTTAGQWIDTGYGPKSTTRTRLDLQPLEQTVQQRIFGARGNGSYYEMYRNGSSKWAYAYTTAASGNWVNTGNAANNTTRRVFDFNYWDSGTGKRYGAIYSTAGSKLWSGALSGTVTKDVTNPLALGCVRSGEKTFAEKNRTHRIYSATISESTSAGETVVRDFTPAAMRGVTGLWDRVEGRLYPSASFQGGGYVGVNPQTNHLEVVNEESWIPVVPAIGAHVCRNGDTIDYSAPAIITNGTQAAVCVGWRRYVNEILVEEGSGNAFSRVKEWGKERVEWRFTTAYQVMLTAGAGGAVEANANGAWFATGTTNDITATAVPAEGYAFLCWSGDVPAGADIRNASLSFQTTEPTFLTASFVHLDGENQVTLFEYVDSIDDRQYINTGYLVTPTTWAVLDAQYLMNEGQAPILGNRGPLHWAIYQRGTAAPGGAGALGFWFNALDAGYADVGKNSDTARHVFRCNYKVDDTTRGFRMYNTDGTAFSSQKTTALQTAVATTPLCIGTWEPSYSKPARHRIYGLAIYEDGSDQPVRDFVPAAMGGATGVYDRIERKFYPSGAGGNYTTGSAPVSGRLYVDSAWRGLVEATPAFGATDGIAAGATVSCTASAAVTNGTTAIACAGYVLRRDGLTVSTGTVNTVTFQHSGGFENLTWLYDTSYRMAFSATAGGSVSLAEGWYAEGATVTATATPDSGMAFFRWEGDLPAGVDPASATLVFAADAPRVLTATFSEATASGAKLYTGADYGDWDTASNWTPEGVPTATDAVYIPAGMGVRIPLTADVFSLTVSNGAIVTVNGPNSRPSSVSGQTAGNTATTGPVGLTVRGDLLLLDAKLGVGGKNAHAYPYLSVGGDFTLSGASSMAIHPGPLDAAGGHDYPDGGAFVSVGGTTTVGSGSGIYPWTHVTTYNKADQELTTGLGTVLNLHDLVVEEGGLVSGYGKGYTRYSKCPSATDAGSAARGGSHGGRGGAVSSANSRLAAFDRPYAPGMPGGGGGNGSATGSVGGGAFRISATTVRLDGTIMSDGNPSTSTIGGAAGGSVFLLCDDLEIGPAGMLSASGLQAGERNTPAGGGGGGRIAVALGLTQAQSAALVADGELPSGVAAREATALLPDGRLIVRGCIGNQWDAAWDDAEDGTAYYLVNNVLSTLAVATTPASRAGVAPSAGLHAYAPGTTVTAAAPAYAPTALDPTTASAPTAVSTPVPVDCASRRVCTGWTLTDGNGAVVASGDTTNATFTVGSGAYTLTWTYGGLEHRLDASAKDGGAVSLDQEWVVAGGRFPALTATPDDADHVFAYWMGDIDATNRFDNPVALPADRARAVVAVFASATPKTYTWNKFANNVANNWHDPASWNPRGIPGPNDTAIISRPSGTQANAQIDQYACVSNLIVRGAQAYLRIGSATSSYGNQNQGYHTPLASFTSPIGLDVLGDLSVTNAGFVIAGGELLPQPAYVNVGGDLVVGGGTAQSRLCIYGCDTNAVADARFGGTSRLTVAGTATVVAPGQLFAPEHYKTDGYAFFSFNDLVVEEGGAVCAYNMGAKNFIRAAREVNYPWPTHQQNAENVYFGGSHGGRGGANAKGSGGAMQYVGEVYGYTNTPVHSGMQGGNNGVRPGGVLRVDARSVVLAGSLRAHGEDAGSNGAGAGGSIWVTCGEFSATESAAINVKGGKPTKDSSGGGGGGRASICVGLTDEQLLALRDSDEVEGVLITPLADVVPGFTAAGGDCAGWNGSSGEDGTGVYIVHVGEGVMLTTSGEPVAAGVVSPAYGVTGQPQGEAFAIEAPETAEVAGTDGRSRYVCGGYLVTNAAGTVLASGAGRTATLTLDEDAFLTWYWTNAEHRVTLGVAGGGTIRTNTIWDASSEWQREGAVFSVTAVPDEGQVFIGWLGEARGLDRESATLEFSPDQARSLTARFATAEAGVKTWIGGNGDWMNDAGWRPRGVPGPATTTLVPSGTVTVDCGFPAPVGSLDVSGGARINVACIASSNADGDTPTANDCETDTVGLRIAGDFDLRGILSLGGWNQLRTGLLEVGGDFVVTNGTASRMSVYGGQRDNWGDPEMFRQGGAVVSVGGQMRVGYGVNIYTTCASLSGAPVVFRLHDLLLEEGGKFYADYGGYYVYISNGELVGYAPGVSRTRADFVAAPYRGGSYGGLGGGTKVTATYGTDFAPYQPGCPGGNTENARGGGAIRIDCTGTAELYGTLTASGGPGTGSRGGRSGGAIWVTARKIVSSPTAKLLAKGGNQADYDNSMGAGGGRICLAQKLTQEQIAELYTATELPKGIGKTDLLTESVPEWQGTINVSGGSLAARPANDGHPGTAVFLRAPIPPTMLLLR